MNEFDVETAAIVHKLRERCIVPPGSSVEILKDDLWQAADRIEQLQAALNAPQVRLLPDAPCPVCGQTFQLSVETNAQCRVKGERQ